MGVVLRESVVFHMSNRAVRRLILRNASQFKTKLWNEWESEFATSIEDWLRDSKTVNGPIQISSSINSKLEEFGIWRTNENIF